MYGVSIMAEKIVREMSLGEIVAVSVPALPIGIILIVALVDFRKLHAGWPTVLVLLMANILFWICLPTAMCKQYNNTHKEYIVQVSDDAKVNKFMDTFEVVSRNGDIYTVKIK